MFPIFNFLNIFSVVSCALIFFWYYRRSAYNHWRKLNIKYVKPVSFFGNIPSLILQSAPVHEDYEKVYKALHDEPFGGIYLLHQPILLIKDPQLVSTILIKDFKHFYDRGIKFYNNKNKELDPLSTHLLFTDGERWRVLRQKMSPVFTSGKLKHMLEQISNCIDRLTEYIDNQMGQSDSVDIGLKELLEKLTIDVIGSCAFGIDCNSFKSNEQFAKMGREAVRVRLIVFVRMLLSSISQRLTDLLKITLFRKEVTDFYLKLTLDTIEYRRQNGVQRNDLLQLLMELQNSHTDPKFAVGDQDKKVLASEQFDELDIAANSFLFLVAGFETTATTISYCLYELAINQSIQEKLRSEVQAGKGTSQKLTYEQLRGMTYMDAVVSETLRKYPPSQFLNRECTEDYVIPGTQTRIPAGTELVVPIWSIHHDWRFYPNPEVFDPDRFMGDEKYSRPSGTYLSFGDGPRFCLGKRFAEMEIKAAVSEMVLKYNLKPCAKTEIPLKFKKGGGLLQTTCGTWVTLERRKY